jgi:hypothetical protein
VKVVSSARAVKMPLVSSALGRVNSETQCTDGVDIEGSNLYVQEGKTYVRGGRLEAEHSAKMLEYLTNTQQTNLKDHHQFIKSNLGNLKNFLYLYCCTMHS